MVDGAPTSAPRPSPGVVNTLLVHNPPRLAIRRKVGVFCIVEAGSDGDELPLPYPARFCRTARGPRVNSRQTYPSTATEPSAEATPKRARECAPS